MVRRVALKAGGIILSYADRMDMAGVENKTDGSPVSHADREAEILIHKSLNEILPGIPVIGEEAAAGKTLPDIENAEYFWLVDPLDGTREFVTGGKDYTVNIALIKSGVPILGVIYAPAHDVLYAGHGPGTSVRHNVESGTDKPINVRPPPRGGIHVIVGTTEKMDPVFEDFTGQYKVEKITKRASSLKICTIAEGRADMYPRFGRIFQWDTAAGDAILRSAGGMIAGMDGTQLIYGANADFSNPSFVAASFDWKGSEV